MAAIRSLLKDGTEAEVFDKRIEVSVIVQQVIAALNAASGNDQINRLTNRNAQLAQCAVIPCCLNGDFLAA